MTALFLKHALLDGVGTLGGYYARGFCKHKRHRLLVGVTFWLGTTAALVWIVG